MAGAGAALALHVPALGGALTVVALADGNLRIDAPEALQAPAPLSSFSCP